MAIRKCNETDPEKCREKTIVRSRRRTTIQTAIFLYLFLRLKMCDISTIPTVKRRWDLILKIRQYIRYQNKTKKRPILLHVSYDLGHCAPLSAILQFFCDHIYHMYKTSLRYLMQVHSVPKVLYKKIMYGLSHYAVLEKLPIVENKKRLIVPYSPPYIKSTWRTGTGTSDPLISKTNLTVRASSDRKRKSFDFNKKFYNW